MVSKFLFLSLIIKKITNFLSQYTILAFFNAGIFQFLSNFISDEICWLKGNKKGESKCH